MALLPLRETSIFHPGHQRTCHVQSPVRPDQPPATRRLPPKPMTYSENISTLQPSATMAVSSLAKRLAAEGRDIINLSAGEPDFDTPDWIAEAGIRAIREGRTRYTPASGLPEVRAGAAGDALARAHPEWELDAGNVVVSAGAKQSLFNACFALFGPGDDVLVAAPYWTSYPEIVGLARARPVVVSGAVARDFRLTPAELDAARTPATRGLILCSPSNPTGAVYSLEELAAVAEWARRHDVWLISDEIYRRICFLPDRPVAPGILDLAPSEVGPFVLVDGVSKTFAMTGWRIGYAISPADLAAKAGALQSQITSNPSTPAQLAALAALTEREQAEATVHNMVAAFHRRRDLVVRLLEEKLPRYSFLRPEGAFYVFLRVDSDFGAEISGSSEWCSRVLEEKGVALVPGSAFGDDRYARLSYAASDREIEEAIARLAS